MKTICGRGASAATVAAPGSNTKRSAYSVSLAVFIRRGIVAERPAGGERSAPALCCRGAAGSLLPVPCTCPSAGGGHWWASRQWHTSPLRRGGLVEVDRAQVLALGG